MKLVRCSVGMLLAAWSMASVAGLADGLEDMKAKNWAGAITEFTPLADQGDAVAEYNLARLYTNGLGAPVDVAKGFQLYSKASDQGYAPAEYGLGLLYLNGTGVAKDVNKTFDLWSKSAEQRNGVAEHGLAILYQGNSGIQRDEKKVVMLYRRAIQDGYTPSIFNLGVIYANGAPEIPKDLPLAYIVFGLAPPTDGSSLGYKGIVSMKLTAEQLARCDAVIKAWVPGTPVPDAAAPP